MELDKVKYWTEISDYDFETAEAMYFTGRWLYVGFMCHQTLEKIFKAYWSSKKVEPAPMSHRPLQHRSKLWFECPVLRRADGLYQ